MAKNKGFDFSRGDLWKCDPSELCIVGGKDVLSKEESGPLDTVEDKTDSLYDPRLRTVKITDEEVANTDAFGVIEAIEVIKRDGVPCVVNGRVRLRRARHVNALRKKRGDAPLSVPFIVVKGDDSHLMGMMLAANALRHDDSPAAKIANLSRYLQRGVKIEDAAMAFGIPVSTAKSWISYDEKATPAVKKAVESGKIEITAGVLLARKEPEAQAGALDEALAAGAVAKPRKGQEGKASVSAVRKALKKGSGASAYEAPGKAELRKLLAFIMAEDHSKSSDKMKAWADGVECALRLVVGPEEGEKVDNRIASRLASALEPEAKE